METIKKIAVGVAMIAVVVLAVYAGWYIFFRATTATNPTTSSTIKNTQSFTTGNQTGGTAITTEPIDSSGINAQQKIFKIADGPVMSATFTQTANPTTTVVRYVMQDSGHVFDIPVSVSGALAQVVSNTTIPGLARAQWLGTKHDALLQYIESGVVKTVYVGFSSTTVGAANSVRVRFLPNNITNVVSSPDGTQVAYLVPTNSGVVGYTAQADGTNPKKLFTSPLTQVLLSWPSTKTLLLQTREAFGVPGIAFSVSASTGAVTPLVHATGLSAIANTTFSKIIYQATLPNAVVTTYAHDVASGKDMVLPFNPLPERCVWSAVASTTMYCAAPLDTTPTNYLDLWHQGVATAADSIFSFNIVQNITSLVAQPGSAQGGVQADIDQVAVSPDANYLLFITRGDRTLWGVHIGH